MTQKDYNYLTLKEKLFLSIQLSDNKAIIIFTKTLISVILTTTTKRGKILINSDLYHQ